MFYDNLSSLLPRQTRCSLRHRAAGRCWCGEPSKEGCASCVRCLRRAGEYQLRNGRDGQMRFEFCERIGT